MEKKSYKWLGALALIPAQGMIFMDQTILPVALPTIQRELSATDLSLEWSVNSYLLFTSMFSLAAGKLGDRFGARRIFFLGIFLFALFSLLAGLGGTIHAIIACRALQGLGAAMIIPSQSALFAAIFPPRERGRATGINVSISSLFLVAGPLIGGALTEISWRWIFWINPLISLIAFALGVKFLPSLPSQANKIDALGFGLFAVTVGSLITYFMQGRVWGWGSLNLLLLLLALASFLFLLKREGTIKHPSLDLSLFKKPTYVAILISICFIQFVLMIGVFRAMYFQDILEYTPSQAGVLSFVSAAPILFISPVGGYLSDRFNHQLPLAIGYLLVIFSFFWFAFITLPTLPSLLVTLIAFGMGLPLIFTPSYSTAMNSVAPQKLGVAFGMISTLRTLSSAMGIALIGLFLSQAREHRLSAYAEYADQERLAEISSFSVIHFGLAFLVILAFAAAFVLHRRKPSCVRPPASPAEGWD